jgi:hypothetical protein
VQNPSIGLGTGGDWVFVSVLYTCSRIRGVLAAAVRRRFLLFYLVRMMRWLAAGRFAWQRRGFLADVRCEMLDEMARQAGVSSALLEGCLFRGGVGVLEEDCGVPVIGLQKDNRHGS